MHNNNNNLDKDKYFLQSIIRSIITVAAITICLLFQAYFLSVILHLLLAMYFYLFLTNEVFPTTMTIVSSAQVWFLWKPNFF